MLNQLELLTPSLIVAYTMWATPGPNNMMLTYSGARFGLKATLPHLLGIVFGTVILNVLAILGLKPLISQWPQLLLVLKIVGTIWLLKIGWRMAHAHAIRSDAKEEKPMAFFAAALFQFANPKAISATLALVSLVLVTIEQQPDLLWVVLVAIAPLSFISILPWAVAGRTIRKFLSTPLRWKLFAWTTGGLTAACAIFLWV